MRRSLGCPSRSRSGYAARGSVSETTADLGLFAGVRLEGEEPSVRGTGVGQELLLARMGQVRGLAGLLLVVLIEILDVGAHVRMLTSWS